MDWVLNLHSSTSLKFQCSVQIDQPIDLHTSQIRKINPFKFTRRSKIKEKKEKNDYRVEVSVIVYDLPVIELPESYLRRGGDIKEKIRTHL